MYISDSMILYAFFFILRLGHGLPTVVHPGNVDTVTITSSNTLNSSSTNEAITDHSPYNGVLSLNMVNRLESSNVTAYISGLDSSGQLILLDRDGSYFYPQASSATPTPLGSNVAIALGPSNTTRTITLPGFINSGRIWIAEGVLHFFVVQTGAGSALVEPSAVNPSDPNAATNYAFAEFNWSANGGLYADISFVDFIGLPLGIMILDSQATMARTLGVQADAANVVCNKLETQAQKDGHPWDRLCVRTADGRLIRVLSPNSYLAMNSSAFDEYFSKYGGYCWDRYTHSPLTIDTQTNAGNVNCSIKGDDRLLTCDGDNRGYAKPTAADVFSCNSGPFAIQTTDNAVHRAIVPRLCAAFNRATLYLPDGHVQPGPAISQYYAVHPANWYAAFVHQLEVDGRGYAFPYDDVAASVAEDQSGLIASSNPKAMTVIVGGT